MMDTSTRYRTSRLWMAGWSATVQFGLGLAVHALTR
jgi:hypothetical protein